MFWKKNLSLTLLKSHGQSERANPDRAELCCSNTKRNVIDTNSRNLLIYQRHASENCNVMHIGMSNVKCVGKAWLYTLLQFMREISCINIIYIWQMFNVPIDDLAVKPYIPRKSLLQWICCKCLACWHRHSYIWPPRSQSACNAPSLLYFHGQNK